MVTRMMTEDHAHMQYHMFLLIETDNYLTQGFMPTLSSLSLSHLFRVGGKHPSNDIQQNKSC